MRLISYSSQTRSGSPRFYYVLDFLLLGLKKIYQVDFFQGNDLNLAGGGVRWALLPRFFGLKFLPLDQLPNAFAQLFLDNEDIFWH